MPKNRSTKESIVSQMDGTRELLSKAFDDFDRDSSGCVPRADKRLTLMAALTNHFIHRLVNRHINSSELGNLCDSLECHLSDQELDEALSMLDPERVGKIEKVGLLRQRI